MSASLLARAPLAVLVLLGSEAVYGQRERVVETLHNLSVSGPGEIRALQETEVCKFCHIPHSAIVPAPLWSRPLSKVEYKTPPLARGRPGARSAPQPDGASRLCLSCHDGTVALGDIVSEPKPLPMKGAERLAAGNRGFLGTDLSGSHPVSFEVTDSAPAEDDDSDMAIRPLSVIREDKDVRLDGTGKMQCTTCHDAHSDVNYVPGSVPRFWVKPTFEQVCLTCHVLR